MVNDDEHSSRRAIQLRTTRAAQLAADSPRPLHNGIAGIGEINVDSTTDSTTDAIEHVTYDLPGAEVDPMPADSDTAAAQFARLSAAQRCALAAGVFNISEYGTPNPVDGKPGGEWGNDTTQALDNLFSRYGVTFTSPDDVLDGHEDPDQGQGQPLNTTDCQLCGAPGGYPYCAGGFGGRPSCAEVVELGHTR